MIGFFFHHGWFWSNRIIPGTDFPSVGERFNQFVVFYRKVMDISMVDTTKKQPQKFTTPWWKKNTKHIALFFSCNVRFSPSGVMFPSKLETLSLGLFYNESLEHISWPQFLQNLTLGCSKLEAGVILGFSTVGGNLWKHCLLLLRFLHHHHHHHHHHSWGGCKDVFVYNYSVLLPYNLYTHHFCPAKTSADLFC